MNTFVLLALTEHDETVLLTIFKLVEGSKVTAQLLEWTADVNRLGGLYVCCAYPQVDPPASSALRGWY